MQSVGIALYPSLPRTRENKRGKVKWGESVLALDTREDGPVLANTWLFA